MKFIVCVEGQSERKGLGDFFKRWLDPKLNRKVGIQFETFTGWSELVKEIPRKTRKFLDGPDADEIIAVIGLMDLYGPNNSNFYPPEKTSASERTQWLKENIENQVGHEKFAMFAAVHETEAWLLSSPENFPNSISDALKPKLKSKKPEQVNFNQPPAELLDELYRTKLNQKFKKTTDGPNLFKKLNPETAYATCPNLAALLNRMLDFAKDAQKAEQ